MDNLTNYLKTINSLFGMKRVSNYLQIFRSKSIIFLAGIMLILVVTNAGFLIYNNMVLARATAIQTQTQNIKTSFNLLWDNVVRNMDLGIRGYALTKDEGLLFPYTQALAVYEDYHRTLNSQLTEQGYPKMEGFQVVKKGYDDYIKFIENMIVLIDRNEIDLFKEELKKDRGLALWKIYESYTNEVYAFQDKLYQEATLEYEKANRQMTVIQISLGIIGVPTLIFMILIISRNETKRKRLFEELEENNRKYLFNPGTSIQVTDERQIINNSIINFKKAAKFINQISTGNLQVEWEGLATENKEHNKQNLAGELIHMREKMKELKSDDSKRMWSTEGLAQFSEIIRTYQHSLPVLCDNATAFIVKYLAAQQGAIFLLREEDEKYLEMISCYAFNKKKHVEKRIEVGQGLVGQVYLEQQPVMLKEIPQAYTSITSGLGEATPSCLLVVPMRYNEKVEAIIEVASFKTYEEYQLEWVRKIGEIMASTLISMKTSEQTHKLLEQFKEQTEQLRAQEEELRQNMEELEATQEEMRRKEVELERRSKEIKA